MSDFGQLQEELRLTYEYIDFLEAGGTGTPPVAPIIKDVPLVMADAATVGVQLDVTNGNWRGVPTEYHYQWMGGSDPIGTDAASYTPVEADVGKQITCVVSAVNAVGTTAAPPSNAVMVAAATEMADAEAAPMPRRENHRSRR